MAPSWWSSWLWWNNPPMESLVDLEQQVIQASHPEGKSWGRFVEFDGDFLEDPENPVRIWTRKFRRRPKGALLDGGVDDLNRRPPFVLVPGLFAVGAYFIRLVPHLERDSDVYLMDWPGFGLSSKNRLSQDPDRCEDQLVRIMEGLRIHLGLDRMSLVGHSFGCYIGALYAMRHPDRVSHFTALDPWGFTFEPGRMEDKAIYQHCSMFRYVFGVFKERSFTSFVRFLGRVAEYVVSVMRYHLNLQVYSNPDQVGTLGSSLIIRTILTSNGEEVFRTLMSDFFWAKRPMMRKLGKLHPNTTLTVIYGEKSWVPQMSVDDFHLARSSSSSSSTPIISSTHVKVVPNAYHHVYSHSEETSRHILETGMT